MEQVFGYIISLGASVMMPIIFTIIGLCIGMKFGKALKSGLCVGVGFVGLGVVTALLTTNFDNPLKAISDLYHLQLNVFDMGWPAAAAVAYNTAVGALIIPICLGINLLMKWVFVEPCGAVKKTRPAINGLRKLLCRLRRKLGHHL